MARKYITLFSCSNIFILACLSVLRRELGSQNLGFGVSGPQWSSLRKSRESRICATKEPTETAVCSAHNVNAQGSLLAIYLDLALYVGIYVKAL